MLVLRPVADADLDAVVAIHADPETSAYRPAKPHTPDQSRELLAGWRAHWAEHGFGYWTLRVDGSEEPIGFGGVQLRERDGEPYLNVYYRLTPSAWGHGYAVELVRAAVELAGQVRPDLDVMIITNVDNVAATKVADRAGFTDLGTADYEGVPCRFYRWRSADG